MMRVKVKRLGEGLHPSEVFWDYLFFQDEFDMIDLMRSERFINGAAKLSEHTPSLFN